MNHSIVFLLAIAVCFGLNEGCATNRVIISNELGFGQHLGYRCRCVWPSLDSGDRILKNNENKTYAFADVSTPTQTRRLVCDLWFGPGRQYYLTTALYRGIPNHISCNQIRQWAARPEGLYLTRDSRRPLVRVGLWQKKY